MLDLLRAHGRSTEGSDIAVSREAREFLQEMIERALLPPAEAPEIAWRPYKVIVLSYLHGQTHDNVARLTGLSSRQLSREKTRAIAYLREVLERP